MIKDIIIPTNLNYIRKFTGNRNVAPMWINRSGHSIYSEYYSIRNEEWSKKYISTKFGLSDSDIASISSNIVCDDFSIGSYAKYLCSIQGFIAVDFTLDLKVELLLDSDNAPTPWQIVLLGEIFKEFGCTIEAYKELSWFPIEKIRAPRCSSFILPDGTTIYDFNNDPDLRAKIYLLRNGIISDGSIKNCSEYLIDYTGAIYIGANNSGYMVPCIKIPNKLSDIQKSVMNDIYKNLDD